MAADQTDVATVLDEVAAQLGGDGLRALQDALARRLGTTTADGEQAAAAPATALGRAWRFVGDLLDRDPPPERWVLRHPTKNGIACEPGEGDGLLPRGEAGCLTAAGGTGKTMVGLSLGISIVIGRPWLDHFEVASHDERGRALVLVGEERLVTVHRRLSRLADTMALTREERRVVAERVVIVPLAGESCPFLAVNPDTRDVVETPALAEFYALLERDAGPDGWSLIWIDPQSRFAGIDAEANNLMATAFVQCIERLVRAPGNPTVLVAGHSSKLSRRAGSVDARGVTGLTDAFRWHATLCTKGENVIFSVAKNNYGPPSADVALVRGLHGILRKANAAEADAARADAEARAAAQLECDVEKVVEALRTAKGKIGRADDLAPAARIRAGRARLALNEAVRRGVVVRHTKPVRYEVALPARASSEPNRGLGNSDAVA